jgi:hypothetical protein
MRKRLKKNEDGSFYSSYKSYCLECLRTRNNERQNKRDKDKRRSDPGYKLRRNVSIQIYIYLKKTGSSKGNKSCLDYLPYSIQDLRDYIETQFSLPGNEWMTWDNYGQYRKRTWNDNDPSTWAWNIDHITPQSDLPYQTMSDHNFQLCWALSNLRPYSAKQNVTDGVNKVRHKKPHNIDPV